MMFKRVFFLTVKNGTKLVFIGMSFFCLLFFPLQAGNGVRTGLKILAEIIIPSLFPFMVLSSYITSSPLTHRLSDKLNKIAYILFKTNGNGIIAFISGFLGGYPVGAKTICEMKERKQLDDKSCKKLLFFCVNPGLSFCVTAVGTFMLKNTLSGIIIYISAVLGSFTTGIFLRFMDKSPKSELDKISAYSDNHSNNEFLFIESVANGSSAMISVCGWVLIFSCICSVINAIPLNENSRLFISCILEVTTGCNEAITKGIYIPFIAATVSFGGFSVIFQVSPYLKKCSVRLKVFICYKIISAALCGIYCFLLLRLFPQQISAAVSFSAGSTQFNLSHSFLGAGVCLLMCIVFIFEVDNKRKVC